MATLDGDPLPYWHPDSEFQRLCEDIRKKYGRRIRAQLKRPSTWSERKREEEMQRRFGISGWSGDEK